MVSNKIRITEKDVLKCAYNSQRSCHGSSVVYRTVWVRIRHDIWNTKMPSSFLHNFHVTLLLAHEHDAVFTHPQSSTSASSPSLLLYSPRPLAMVLHDKTRWIIIRKAVTPTPRLCLFLQFTLCLFLHPDLSVYLSIYPSRERTMPSSFHKRDSGEYPIILRLNGEGSFSLLYNLLCSPSLEFASAIFAQRCCLYCFYH